jgi:SGNH domain (fused to AT3 domains)
MTAALVALLVGLPIHADPPDPTSGPLDLASASVRQQGTRFELRVSTRGAWQGAQLSVGGPASLCLVLSYGRPTRPRSEACIAGRHGSLERLTLDPRGAVVATAGMPEATVTPNGRHGLLASFSPLDAGLPRGRFAWRIESRWARPPACVGPVACIDRLPDSGDVGGRAVLLAGPRCFGAAARDPAHPCSNPALARAVTPTPSEALITPNAPCTPHRRLGLVNPCEFGAAPAQAKATVALVGDSHAEHWRGAIEVVAQARRWRGISITHASCPFSRAAARLVSPALTRSCRRWNADTRRWLRHHRDVHTVITSADSATVFAGDPLAGYRAAWRGLPASVRHVLVLRDTPRIVSPQAACVQRLLRAHRRIGYRCAQPRAEDLPPDPAAVAARSWRGRRVRAIDLSRQMCTTRVCPAVIGGVLVRKDGTHLTRLFSTTLGPFVLRAVRRAGL